MAKSKPLPRFLYVERWPEEAQRQDSVHYEPTGFGDDMRGNTSTITMYRRLTREEVRDLRRKAKR